MPDSLIIRVNGRPDPFVTDDPNPRLNLWFDGVTPWDSFCFTLEDALGQTVWTSPIGTFPQRGFTYSGPPLRPKSAYTVRATAFYGQKPAAQARGKFETGFMEEKWAARWIEPDQQPCQAETKVPFHELFMPNDQFFGGHTRLRPCPEIKRDFELIELPKAARLYASAHGVYELKVNGAAPGGNLLAPETSAYQSRLYYQTYDILPLLRAGQNTLEVTLADGWWAGRIGVSGESCQYGDRLGLILQAEFTKKDGQKELLCSDRTFLGRRSNTDYSDLFIGERRDFTRPEGPFAPCVETDCPRDNLTAQPIEPIRAYMELSPKEWLTTPKGELIADFGQVLSGVMEIEAQTEAGREITLDFCEVLDREGNFSRNILGRNKDQRDVFVTKEGSTVFCPRFTYHGFRYARVTGVDQGDIVRAAARVIGTPLRERGQFGCSDDRLNQLQHNILWSTRSNMCSVPTDCPQREKVGWTGDILTFGPTGCFNYDLDAFLCAWLENMRAEQGPNGEIPVAVPNYPMQDRLQRAMSGDNTSSAWSDACVHTPWQLYDSYGEKGVLRMGLEMMEGWLEYIARVCARRPRDYESLPPAQRKWNDYLWNKGYHFGDWFIPSLVRQEGGVMKCSALTRDVVGSCFYAITIATFIKVLDALIEDEPKDPKLRNKREHFSQLLETVKLAVRECFISEEGIVQGDMQGLYVIALKAEIAEGELKARLAARLAKLVEENGFLLDTGFVTVPYLLDALAQNGYRNVAYALLFQTQAPSWLYMVEKGATSIWENWEAIRPDGTSMPSSFNHYALGCVGDWLYRNIGGISAQKGAAGGITFAPDIYCGLKSAHCALDTPLGRAACSWRWREGLCEIKIVVPYNAPASLELEGRTRALSHGEHTFTIREREHGRA